MLHVVFKIYRLSIILLFIIYFNSNSIGKNIKLYDVDSNTHISINHIAKESKGIILVFYSNSCPICLNHTFELNQIYSQSKLEDVSMYLVIPESLLLSMKEIKTIKDSINIEAPILIDKKNKLVKKLGATTFPQTFLLDTMMNIQYNGQITNKYVSIGVRKATNHATNYLLNALKNYTMGEPIHPAITIPMGCKIESYGKRK